MMSRRTFFKTVLASFLALLTWFNFTPSARALGGKIPPLNQHAPVFTLPTNTGEGNICLYEAQLLTGVCSCSREFSQRKSLSEL